MSFCLSSNLSSLCTLSSIFARFSTKVIGKFCPPRGENWTARSNEQSPARKLKKESYCEVQVIGDRRGKNFTSLQLFASAIFLQIPAPGPKVIGEFTDFTRTVNWHKAFRGIPSEKRWRSYCKVSDGSPGAAIKVPNFYPRSLAAAFLNKRKTPASSDTGVSPTFIEWDYLFFRALHHAECEVCTRRFIVWASPHAKCWAF